MIYAVFSFKRLCCDKIALHLTQFSFEVPMSEHVSTNHIDSLDRKVTPSLDGAPRVAFSFKPFKVLSLMAICASAFYLSACSIKDETSEEQKIEPDTKISLYENPTTPEDKFIHDAIVCIQGDLSGIDKLIETYKSSFVSNTNYKEGSFLYQRIGPTKAYEKCAEKAASLGNRTVFNNMFISQGKIARSARYFYAVGEPTQGAFWLQRLVNVKGEVDAYEIAGRIFIQDVRTLKIGVKLLEQSARMGNRNARQMLLGLMNPGSLFYHQLTSPNNDISGGINNNTTADTTNNKDLPATASQAATGINSPVATTERSSTTESASASDTNNRSYARDADAPEADRKVDPADAIGADTLPQQQIKGGVTNADYSQTVEHANSLIENDYKATPDTNALVPESDEKKAATQEGAYDGPATYTEAAIDAALNAPQTQVPANDNYDPVSVINSSDTELNTPLEIYEMQSSLDDASGNDTKEEKSQGEAQAKDAANGSQSNNVNSSLNLQQQKQLKDEDRLRGLQEKADAATKAVMERTKQYDNKSE